MDSSNIILKGFHFHVGSQLFDSDLNILAVNTTINLMKKLKEKLNFTAKELNIGGFGIRYTNEDDETKPIISY